MVRKHSTRQDDDATTLGNGGYQVGTAEYEERHGPEPGDPLDRLRLGVCLLEHPRVDRGRTQPPAMALRLDREDPRRSDEHMIDIPVVQLHVVQSEPAALAQTLERLANKLLASGTTTPSVHDARRCPVDQHHAEDDGQLDHARRPAESQQHDREHQDRKRRDYLDDRPMSEPALSRTSMLTRPPQSGRRRRIDQTHLILDHLPPAHPRPPPSEPP